MPSFNSCSMYDANCRNKTCDHVVRETMRPKMLDSVLDIMTENGVPFRVVYGYRQYPTGDYSNIPTVTFYDRRYNHTPYGQFVTDYTREVLLARNDFRGGLNLFGGVSDWCVDASAMFTIRTWLNHMTWQEEN